MMEKVMWVMLGGALGAAGRYGVSVWMSNFHTNGFPWATFSVNMLGCLLIGVFWKWLSHDATNNWLLPLLVTGFLGGFTTFSAFGLESFQMWKSGQVSTLIFYLVMSNILGIVFVFTGNKLGALIGK